MGPFGIQKDPDGNPRYKSSWYGDYSYFASASYPWFFRGGVWGNGSVAGDFAFGSITGGTDTTLGFRVVLTPQASL